eukprot:3215340-Rhodomonas_salina.3
MYQDTLLHSAVMVLGTPLTGGVIGRHRGIPHHTSTFVHRDCGGMLCTRGAARPVAGTLARRPHTTLLRTDRNPAPSVLARVSAHWAGS